MKTQTARRKAEVKFAKKNRLLWRKGAPGQWRPNIGVIEWFEGRLSMVSVRKIKKSFAHYGY